MELEVVAGRIAAKEEGKNHQESGDHYEQQRQSKQISAGAIDGRFLPRGDALLRRGRVQQGMASEDCMFAQRLLPKLRK